MKVIRSIPAAGRLCAALPRPLALVPTMGALHRGHTTLIERARKQVGAKGSVAVSIFVNPTQFGPREDFARYPRPLEADLALCKHHGVDLLFQPDAAAIYPPEFSTFVEEHKLSTALCGASRPGHFRGVCTVVAKLFNILRPDLAFFGLKDFQQCMVITRMVADLNLGVRIIPVETVREPDGLALSSRNRHLTPEERAQAPVLRAALLAARQAATRGETSAAKLRALIIKKISSAPLAKIDYVTVADANSLQPVRVLAPSSVLAVAVFFGKTRLIDNLWLR